jgi:prepilin-type N-terminal cleavage/methylation domain-containing protein
MRTHRGFTLVELMVAMVLTLAVCGVTYKILLTNQQVARTQSEHVGMQDNVRAGGLIVSNELREVGYDSVPTAAGLAAAGVVSGVVRPALQIILPGRLEYKAMRGLGFTCAVPTSTQLKLRWYNGLRNPAVNDSVANFVDGDASRTDDDAWVHAKITAVAASTCADGVTPAIQLTIAYPGVVNGATVAGKMIQGGPVRVFEIMQMRYYVSNGQSWLGMLSQSDNAPQPVVGPLADSTATQRGLTFGYLDNAGNPTAVAANVRTITVTLRGVSDYAIRTTKNYSTVDTLSMTSTIALRNALRP